MNELFPLARFSDGERQALAQRLGALLGAQTRRSLSCDSTSVSSETARELFASLLWTLRLALAADGRPERDLLTADPEALLRQGQRAARDRLAAARRLWEQACLTAPPCASVCLNDSLKALGAYFRRYDAVYFAHRLPCAIDYPLCVPVPEETLGVSYAEAWLRRLLAENRLLGRFPARAAEALLSRADRGYRDGFGNLCEQPLVNAAGLALLGLPVFSLALPEGGRAALERTLTAAGVGPALGRAADAVSAQLSAPEEEAAYLRAALAALRPRLEAALPSGGIGGVFLF